MLNSFLEKHRYTLLGAVLIVLILAFFCFVDVPYTIYGVSVDSQMAEPDVLPVPEYQAGSDHGAVVLMYHHLVPDGGETNSLTVTEGKFRRDMEYLREHGYQTLLPDELNEILRGTQKCPKKAVVISFDDGYQSNYSIAYPVLKENGLRAVIALITANIREEKEENAFMLCWPEVREMSDSGLVSFGSHSHNLHNPDIGGAVRKGPDAVNGVQRLPDEKQVQYAERVGMDIAHSCTMIEQYTGVPVHWFAYPYGAGDRWCEKLLDAMDVTVSVSTQPGIARVGHGVRDLPRYGIREDTDLSDILPS